MAHRSSPPASPPPEESVGPPRAPKALLQPPRWVRNGAMGDVTCPTLWGLIATLDDVYARRTWDQAVRGLVGPAPWFTLTVRRHLECIYSYVLHVVETGPVQEVRAYVQSPEFSPRVPSQFHANGIALTRGKLHIWRASLTLEEFLDRWAALEEDGLFRDPLPATNDGVVSSHSLDIRASNGAEEVSCSVSGDLGSPANQNLRRILASLHSTLPDLFR